MTDIDVRVNGNEAFIMQAFGLHSWETQALDAVEQVLAMRDQLGTAKCYEAIFATRRRQGATTRERVRRLAKADI